jgi:hypothetical protein
MTFSRLFKAQIGAAVLAGSLLAMPIAAEAQYGSPAPQNGSPNGAPLGENNGQYTSPPAPAGASSDGQDPNGGQYGAPGAQPDGNYPDQQGGAYPGAQNGVPSGIEQAPPPIPDYQQPPAPGDGYIWTPGYWAYGPEGYEWINGAWVNAPYTGALWTPGYWGDADDGYFWNAGYWGPTIGYYGGINYGFGYFGIGFYGGYWGGGRFWYNRAYCNIGVGRGFNVYNRSYSGFSGRPGGASFVRASGFAGSRSGGNFSHGASLAANRGSAINGNVHSNGFAHADNRPANGGGGNSAVRSFNGGSNYGGASRGMSQPSAQSHANFTGGNPGGFHGAPAGGAPGGGAPAGGGYHGGPSGGGGGGSHGGGGGHR